MCRDYFLMREAKAPDVNLTCYGQLLPASTKQIIDTSNGLF